MRERKMTYEEFRAKIQEILRKNQDGLPWTDIRRIGKFHQKVPNNKWVRMLERDIGIKRKKVGTKVIWKLR